MTPFKDSAIILNMAEFVTSLEYEKKLYPMHCAALKQSKPLSDDLSTMLKAIEQENHKLAQLEVVARRNPSYTNIQKCVNQSQNINSLIENFEQYLTFSYLVNK